MGEFPLAAFYKCKMLEKNLVSRSSKCVHGYGISAELCSSSCYPFHLVLLYFVQQENNLDPVCKQIWAASACAGPRIWKAGKWYREKLELSRSKPAGEEEQSRSSAQLSGSSALSLWCGSSASRPELASACTLCSSGRNKGVRDPGLLPEGWDQTALWCQITRAGFSSASILLQAWVWIVWIHRIAWVCWLIPSALWLPEMPVLVQRARTYLSQEVVLCASSWQLFKHGRAQPWKFSKNKATKPVNVRLSAELEPKQDYEETFMPLLF